MSLFTDDAYAILGVDPKTATTKDIKTAYRKLALLHHPDRHTDEAAKAEATQKFAKIANAYEILSDEHLRAEYDRSRPDPCSTPMYSTSSSSPKNNNKKKNHGSSKSSSSPEAPPFRYHFSDPYEVFKRDFREQFGIEYPGAQYDWVDFDTPIFVHPEPTAAITNSNTPQITNGPSGNNASSRAAQPSAANNKNQTYNKDTEEKKNTKKKGLFNNLFRRNKTKEDATKSEQAEDTSNNNQLVVADTKNSALVTANSSALANIPTSSSLVNKNAGEPYDYSTAIVQADKRNNRPVKMEVKTETNGPITTTITEITRPDGTVERMVMRTGIPGPDPKKKLMLTNGPETNLLTNGDKQNQKQLTHDPAKEKKLLTDANGKNNKARLTNGATKKNKQAKPLAIENGNKSQAKTKLLTN